MCLLLMKKYHKVKNDIRRKIKKPLSHFKIKRYIEHGRNKSVGKFIKKRSTLTYEMNIDN